MAAADVEFRCFVGGLAWATDSHSLEQAFGAYDEVIDSKIINDRETGRSRGFGFVTFGSEQAMKDAIEGMNNQNLDGRSITVNEDQSRGSGGGGGGGGGFRSGGGGGGYSGGYGGGRCEGDGGTAVEAVEVGTAHVTAATGVGPMAGAGGTEKYFPRFIYVWVSEFGF